MGFLSRLRGKVQKRAGGLLGKIRKRRGSKLMKYIPHVAAAQKIGDKVLGLGEKGIVKTDQVPPPRLS